MQVVLVRRSMVLIVLALSLHRIQFLRGRRWVISIVELIDTVVVIEACIIWAGLFRIQNDLGWTLCSLVK